MTEQRNPTYYEISNIKTNGLRPARFAQKEADREVREKTRGLAPEYNRKGKGGNARPFQGQNGQRGWRSCSLARSTLSLLQAVFELSLFWLPYLRYKYPLCLPNEWTSITITSGSLPHSCPKIFFSVAINCFLTLTSVHLYTSSSRKPLAPNLWQSPLKSNVI